MSKVISSSHKSHARQSPATRAPTPSSQTSFSFSIAKNPSSGTFRSVLVRTIALVIGDGVTT